MQEKKKGERRKKRRKVKVATLQKKNQNKVVFLWLNSILWNLYLVVNLY